MLYLAINFSDTNISVDWDHPFCLLANSHVYQTFHVCHSRMSVECFMSITVECLPNVSYTIFLSIRTTNSHVCRTFHTDSLCRLEPQIRMSVERFIHNRYVDQNHIVIIFSTLTHVSNLVS